MNAIRDIGNTIRHKLIKSKEIAMNVLQKCGNMMRRLLTAPKHSFYQSMGIVRNVIMAESLMRYVRGSNAYIQLFIAALSITKVTEYFQDRYFDNFDKDWDKVYDLLSSAESVKKRFIKLNGLLNNVIVGCYICGIFPAIYMDKPYIVHSVFALVSMIGLFLSFESVIGYFGI